MNFELTEVISGFLSVRAQLFPIGLVVAGGARHSGVSMKPDGWIILVGVFVSQAVFSDSSNPQALVNLGMLEGTRISASSVNGARAVDDPYYGALNLFDGGENRINNLNYTTWLTDNESRHWVKLHFDAPMEVDSIMLEVPGRDNVMDPNPMPNAMPTAGAYACRTGAALAPRPTEFAIDFITEENRITATRKLPSVEITGFRLYYPLKKAVQNVTEVTVVFPGPSMIEISELEVMGVSGKTGELPRPKRTAPAVK